MAEKIRTKGTAIFAVNFEPTGQTPLDARLVVDDMAMLLSEDTYVNAGNNFYAGMPVIVKTGDSGKSELWVLVDTTKVTQREGWQRLDADSEAINNTITDIINELNVTDTAVDGEFVTSVKQTNGKIDIVRGQVNSDKVVATPINGDATTVAINGANVDLQIKSIGKTLKEVQDNAAKYEVVKLTSEEITALADENVKEAYKVVSYIGDKTTATKTQVGETIKIYKDSSLKSVSSSGEENTIVTFIYTLANGTEQTVTVDLGKAIFESEMGDGIKLVDSKIAIKLDTDGETFLTVGGNGLKLSGIQNAINTTVTNKINELDATVGSTTVAENKHVAIQVVEENGKLTNITVTENNIASSSDLDVEIERAKGAEKTNADAITAMKLTTVGGNGKFIKTISQNDGKVTATAEDLKASNVNLETVSKDDVTLEASTVQLGIQKLFEKIKDLEDDTEIDCGVY